MIATKAGATLLGNGPPSLPRPAVIVTGASSGIGYATALRLARSGTLVYAGVRRQGDADTVAREGGENVRPILLDVTDAESIAHARSEIAAARDSKLVGLVNNAGIATGGPLEMLPMAELRRVFEVNFFATIAMTQAFLPLIREHRGRIVNVSSIGGKLAPPLVGAYAASKFALEAASDALRLELRPFGVGVVWWNRAPSKRRSGSAVPTRASESWDTIPEAARIAYDDMIRNMVRLSQKMEKRGIAPERVAAVIERALTDRHPRARYLVGVDARVRLFVARLPEGVRDRIVAAVVGAPTRPPRKTRAPAKSRVVGA